MSRLKLGDSLWGPEQIDTEAIRLYEDPRERTQRLHFNPPSSCCKSKVNAIDAFKAKKFANQENIEAGFRTCDISTGSLGYVF